MALMHVRVKVALAVMVLSTSVMSAQQGVPPATTASALGQSASAAPKRAARETQSLIDGVVVNSDQVPLPRASIRLRNLAVNAIEQIATANVMGQFTFVARPQIPYVVEIADQTGRTVAVGDVILANAGEVAGVKLVLPSRLPQLAGLFDDTARTVVAAATASGVTPVDPALPKVSPSR